MSIKIEVEEAAKATGHNRQWLAKLTTRAEFPLSDGCYDVAQLIAGIVKHFESKKSNSNLRDENMRKKNTLLDYDIAEAGKKYVLREKVQADLAAIERAQRGCYQKVLEGEWPAKAVGKSQIELIEIGKEMTDKLCAMLRDPKTYA